MKRFSLLPLLLAALAFSIKLLNPFGPTLMPIAFVISGEIGRGIEVSYWRTPDEAIARIKSSDADFYILPLTLGVNLKASGFDLILLGVHEWKVFYLVGPEGTKVWEDLKGKTVYVAHSRGTVLDVLLRMFLKKHGLSPDEDVKLVYAQPPEIVALFKAGKVHFAALPEPFVTVVLASGRGEIVLDFQEEWKKLTGLRSRIPIAGLFTTSKVLNERPGDVFYVEQTLRLSTMMMNSDPRGAAELVSKITKIPSKILEASTKRMVFEYVPIEKCKKEVEEFLKVLKEEYPQGIKAIPGGEFYR